MANSIKTLDGLRVDLFQALKRAMIHREGVVPIVKRQPAKKVTREDDLASLPIENDELSADSVRVQENDGSKRLDESEKKAEEGPEEMLEITERAHEVLYEANTVFPFTLFPSTLTLDREKLTIAHRTFWRTAEITSVPISEILSCKVNVGPFFGSLHLVFSFFADNQRTISYLWRKDATEMQRMIHGYIIAHKREINTTNVGLDDLKILLKEIGQGATE